MTAEALGEVVTSREVVSNGVRLHLVERGSGPPVLLLHGFPEFWYAWRHQMPALAAAGYRAVAPDMRGYNLSEKPPGVSSYRLSCLVGDALGVIGSLGGTATVVGHDWGGVVAWALAARHPEAVERLVILNAPHPLAYRREAIRSGQLLRSWYALAFGVPLVPELLLRASGYAPLLGALRLQPARPGAFTDDDIRRYREAIGRPGALEAAINYYRAALLERERSDREQSLTIRVPTLVLWGERDPYLSPRLADGLERWVPGVRVRRFPRASHWLMADEPDPVNEAIIGFLS